VSNFKDGIYLEKKKEGNVNRLEGVWRGAVRILGYLEECLNEQGAVILASKKRRR